jgi:hypothetical protein
MHCLDVTERRGGTEKVETAWEKAALGTAVPDDEVLIKVQCVFFNIFKTLAKSQFW